MQHAPLPPMTFVGTGEMATLIREFDWSTTSLGPIGGWRPTVKAVVALMQRSPLPIVTLWGEDGIMIYNDAYSLFAGSRHPSLLGSRVREGWPEVADFNDNVIRKVFRGGETLSYDDQILVLDRGRGPEQAWLKLDYSQIVGDDGTPLGVIAIVVETTDKVAIDRQLRDERIRLRQMYEQSASFMALLEGREQRFAIVNPAYAQLVGGRDVVGKTLAEVLPEAVEQGYGDLLSEVFRSGQPYLAHSAPIDLELVPGAPPERRHVDFIYQPISDVDGRVTGIFVNGIDVTEGVAAQEALKESEAKFRTFAEAMPNHAWTATPDGQLDWFNERVGEYSGRPSESLAADRWLDIVHPDDAGRTVELWSDAMRSGVPYQTEFRIRRRDGQYRWHLVRAHPVYNPSGKIVRWVGTNTDIHEQKLAEAESARDRDRLWSLSQDLMLVFRLDGTIMAVNPSATRLLGWTNDEMVGQSVGMFLHPDDASGTWAEMQRLASGATTAAFENRFLCKDGDYRILDWTAAPEAGRIHAIGRDITEARRISRDRDRIWNLSPVLKVVMDHQGLISAISPAWAKTLGWPDGETVGQNIMDFVVPESQAGALHRLRQLARPNAMTRSESVLFAKDGERKTISWTAVSEAGTIYAFGRDITVEAEAAAALKRSEEALLQSQKMEAIGQLTGGVAHDFNNLLQVVSGNLQLLAKDLPADGKAAQRIQNAMEGVTRGSRLASQLLAFGRRQPLAPKVVNLARLVRGMDDMLRRALGEAIQIETIISGGLWNTMVDPGNVENALLNLGINSRDAMEGQGKLTIEAGNAYLDDRYAREHADVMPGQYVVLAVTDTGSGMTADVMARAFEPFFTTKPEGRGTGLGLSMVYGFVKQSGGHTKVYSEVGEGTTVKLYFPRVMQAEDELVQRESNMVAGGKETILVAEDDAAVRETVIETLSDMGYRVLQAPDAQAALAVISSGVPIDLLFSDVVMPGPLKAVELARKAVQRQPALKVLFTSGYTENSIVHGGRLDDGVELLSKPYTREALALKIRAILDDGKDGAPELSANGPQTRQPAASILLCEDDPLIRMATAGMLQDLGHDVVEAGRGAEALELLKTQTVDLLMTDIGLPDINGADLAREARRILPDVPIIFATGHSSVDGVALDDRMRLLPKPFDEAMLAQTLDPLLSRADPGSK